MRRYKARGIVLHTIKYGDTSVVAFLLTDVDGRRNFMVQGVRSTRGHGSRFALLQPMFPVYFEGVEPRRGELHRLIQLRAGVVLQGIPFDVRKSAVALFMAEVLYRLVQQSEPGGELFEFVWESVAALDGMRDGTANFHLWFLARLSRYLGFAPGNDYAQGDRFDMREGLFTPRMPQHGVAMERPAAAMFARLLAAPAEELGELALNRTQRVEFLNALLVYYGYHLDAIHAVKSVDILRELF